MMQVNDAGDSELPGGLPEDIRGVMNAMRDALSELGQIVETARRTGGPDWASRNTTGQMSPVSKSTRMAYMRDASYNVRGERDRRSYRDEG